ncbi:MAG: acetylglucosamine-6-sulfatase, partial [Kiritimatiellae bacterium]|nr:acetylglucosamine-6-sulfatase [Kiritimatiellia bacterium]
MRKTMMRTLFMLTAAVCAAACAEVKPWHTRSETTPSLRALIPAVPDASWTTNWWMGRHEAKMKEVRAGGAPIVFLGDSITHFWESNGRAVWDRYFATGRYRALNLGFSGDRTEHVLWRIAHGELDGYNAKAIVLMLGTNNSGHFPIEKETPEDTIVGMKAVLMAIRDKQPQAKIILCAIFPRGRDANDACRRRNAAV